MPQEVVLRGPNYAFECYGVHEAKQLGLIDSWGREGTHAPVSTVFEQGEGKLLADWVSQVPDALLVATGRYQITVFRPKSRMILMEDDEESGDEMSVGWLASESVEMEELAAVTQREPCDDEAYSQSGESEAAGRASVLKVATGAPLPL